MVVSCQESSSIMLSSLHCSEKLNLLTLEANESWYCCHRSGLALFVFCGWFLLSVRAWQLVTYWIISNIIFQHLTFSDEILSQSCTKPCHLKHFKENLHHSGCSDIKATAFLGEQWNCESVFLNTLICRDLSVCAFLPFIFFFLLICLFVLTTSSDAWRWKEKGQVNVLGKVVSCII